MKNIVSILIFISLTGACSMNHAGTDGWLFGKWELTYDPDKAEKDYIEFLPEGDVISTGPRGRVEGIYIVTPEMVKVVLTYRDKDFIMTFFYNDARTELRIVTSHTGRESVYKKMPATN